MPWHRPRQGPIPIEKSEGITYRFTIEVYAVELKICISAADAKSNIKREVDNE